MSITLDGQALFDNQQADVSPASIRRDYIERSIAGVNGLISIDLGERDRKITQKGVLRARSWAEMSEKIKAISAYMDGDTHTLITDNGEQFDNLRMDVFKVTDKRTNGASVVIDYEIVYTQLRI